jgi:hypothetical protein
VGDMLFAFSSSGELAAYRLEGEAIAAQSDIP